jgi:drug/metabolite transporter (DMT)-like permease
MAGQLYVFFQFIYQLMIKIAVNDHAVNTLDTVFYYNFASLVFSTVVAYSLGISLEIKPGQKSLMVWRALLGNVGLMLMTVGVAMVPLVTVQIILMTVPFWAAIVSVLFTSDQVKKNEIVIMVISFICVCVISINDAKKTSLTEEIVVEEVDESTFLAGWSAGAVYSVGALVMLACAIVNSVITV